MPKTPQLPAGALSDAAQSSGDQQSDHNEWTSSANESEDLSCLDSDLLDVDLMAMRTDTPADVLLCILADMLDGRQPDLRDVALARSALLRHMDLYEPLNSGGLIRSAGLEADVADALMHQLGASTATTNGVSVDSPTVSPGPPRGTPNLSRSPSLSAAQSSSTSSPASAASSSASSSSGLPASTAICGHDGGNDDDDYGGSLAADNLRDALAALLGLPAPPRLLQLRRSSADEEDAASTGSSSWGSGSDSDGNLQSRGSGAVPTPLMEEVEQMLAQAYDSWQYDTWRLADVTQVGINLMVVKGHALSCLSFYLLHREGLISQFRIQPTKLARLLRALESGYPSNPYHNSTHAADVLQTLHVLLRGAGLTPYYLDSLGLMAMYFAAIIHDHGHPGLTADFLIATSDPLAVRYNDRAPLENHHGASFFALMQQPEMNVMEQLTGQERTAFRKQVLDLVMATDMKQHFSLLAHFNTAHHLAAYNKDIGPWALARNAATKLSRRSRNDTEAAGGGLDVVGAGVAGGEGLPGEMPRPLDEAERTLSLQIFLKAADLGHLGEELGVHQRWVRSLEEEFFLQGDKEQQLGLPISPLFDRSKQGVSKSQVGFYDFIALPLVHSLASAFPGAKPLLACFVDNYDHWRAVERAAAASAAVAAAQQTQTAAAAAAIAVPLSRISTPPAAAAATATSATSEVAAPVQQ
ncbi:hypothetical protein Vretimale_6637 [Volvox reticuliferus]|uniref:PDEase domain-containing protein n=1 Tax=Volvox reticuliferus TaxID=1737510 RepID=A0A8J4G882_9CHLO|nr:hypothetical protein Vretimale_6637 [Volvox reticuliferus]